jgi:menaquinone-dependent protoporphyrinogen IX oxidase
MRAAVFYATREGHTRCIAEHIASTLATMIAFVKRHRKELERLGAAFLSVTLSEAGAEDPAAPKERREQGIARKAGAPTDASRDYEFTDWTAPDRFANDVVSAVA